MPAENRPPDEVTAGWVLSSTDRELLANKHGATRLGFAVLLRFFQMEGRFPGHAGEIGAEALATVAEQTDVPAAAWADYDWRGRTVEYHRAQIRAALGFREATVGDGRALAEWLVGHVVGQERQPDRLRDAVARRCRALCIEPPSPERVERLVRSALHTHEERFTSALVERLSPETRARFDEMLSPGLPLFEAADHGSGRALLHDLREDPGRASLESVRAEAAKLARVRALALPADLFAGCSPGALRAYRRRVGAEETHELRRHPSALRLTLLAAFCHGRGQEITDGLVDLLIDTVHRIGARAEQRVERELIADLKRVSGKHGLLFQLAEAALANPEGRVREVLFPVVEEATLRDLVREWKATGPVYRQQLRAVMRNSYRSHFRQMVPVLLGALEFRSNNAVHRPVVLALELLRRHLGSKARFYPAHESVPMEGVVRGPWLEVVREEDGPGRVRVNRLTYEMCVLQVLREGLRCKEIWVEGASRYRNPDQDLPADFKARRETYYAALRLPERAREFTDRLRADLHASLDTLDRGLADNPHVRVLTRGRGWIALSPLEAQPEPTGLGALKAELGRRWPTVSLLDILKESELRVGFTAALRSPTAYENLDRDVLRERLILTLHGLGTNTGLKRMAAGQPGTAYKDLLYVRRRFVSGEGLRAAIAQVVNAILRTRRTEVWGEATSACASDSKKFGAWDQNLMTEWHVRYGGRGVMIYWQVERKSTCFHSQMKTCSSSEAAAMIAGVLRHCTEMVVEKNYVDSHGQSEVAFAFCHLLGFQLLPRLRAIHAQRLYRPQAGQPEAYPRLQPVLSRPIDWDLIERQYDAMVAHATALRLGSAEPEDLLRRFTRANVQHPTYRALAELGKARKTIFLGEYLRSEALRREVHEGLNVIEAWNSANDFILYGRGGEIASNQFEDQEITMLGLHLLQACLVYINTLMLQRVLGEPAWLERLSPADRRGLTPLFWSHVNPYGTFHLDMNARLLIEPAPAT